jgi:1-acyl-sn-glycerol-3-phosphate acyltransferase
VVLVFLVLVPFHVLASLLGARNLVPPVFLGAMGRVAGLRVRTVGEPLKGALYLANHESWLDILALAGRTEAIFVGHSGLADSAFIRWLAAQNKTVFITRHQRGSVARQVEQVRAALSERPVVIFPEGTTNDGTGLLPFRSSLLAAVEPLAHEVPVQPVALDFKDVREVGWFGDEPGLANVLRVLERRGRIDLTIRFLPALSGEALADRKAMTAAARAAIEHALEG